MKIVAVLALFFTMVFGDKTVTIASYNVENLFDLHKSGYEYKEFFPNSISKWNLRNYRTKLNNLSQVIKDMDADIVALQEVESLRALKDLRVTLKRAGLYYKYFNIAYKKNTTTKVALLSKIPMVYVKELGVTSSLKYRNILEIKLSINKKEIYLFINHWKAKSGPESQRIVSAKAILKRVKQIGYDKNIILVGDFNSDYEEYKRFKRERRLNDTGGKTGINHILKTINQKQRADSTKYEKNSFYNLWYDTIPNDRFSYIFRGKKEALDNILVSQSLLDKKGVYYKNGSIKSFRKPYMFRGKKIYRWQMTRKKPKRHIGRGYSDHLPVMAKFIVSG